jgi:hypothetical protein
MSRKRCRTGTSPGAGRASSQDRSRHTGVTALAGASKVQAGKMIMARKSSRRAGRAAATQVRAMARRPGMITEAIRVARANRRASLGTGHREAHLVTLVPTARAGKANGRSAAGRRLSRTPSRIPAANGGTSTAGQPGGMVAVLGRATGTRRTSEGAGALPSRGTRPNHPDTGPGDRGDRARASLGAGMDPSPRTRTGPTPTRPTPGTSRQTGTPRQTATRQGTDTRLRTGQDR